MTITSTRSLFVQGQQVFSKLEGESSAVELGTCGPWIKVGESLFKKEIPFKYPVVGTGIKPVPAGQKFIVIPSCSALLKEGYGFRFAFSTNSKNHPITLLDSVGSEGISNTDVSKVLGISESNIQEESNIDFYEIERTDLKLMLLFKIPRQVDIESIGMLVAVTVIPKSSDHQFPWQDIRQTLSISPLPVPSISQFEHGGDIGRRICSATSVAMVLSYHQKLNVDPKKVAALVYSSKRDMYGIWPRSIWAASRFGIIGMVTSVNSWDEVAGILKEHNPLVATVTYKREQLVGAAIDSTEGHLLTIVGLDADRVIVNDPAAKTDSEVRRSYDLGEFSRAWFAQRSGICYQFFGNTNN